jgi:hypothetical protein
MNASVKYVFKKWKETTKASNQRARARADSTITIDTSQTFEEFEHRTSSGSEDNISSSVTTTSSLRYYPLLKTLCKFQITDTMVIKENMVREYQ